MSNVAIGRFYAVSRVFFYYREIPTENLDARVVNTTQQAASIHTFYYYLITKRHQLDLVLEVPNVWYVYLGCLWLRAPHYLSPHCDSGLCLCVILCSFLG